QPVPDLPVTVFPWDGRPASGRTGADGVFRTALPVSSEPWRSTEAFVGTADDPGWATTAWNTGISPWDYNLSAEIMRLPYRIHVYTDRPLYRAGDTLHYRAVIRTDRDALYDVPANLTVEAILRNPQGEVVYRRQKTTDAYGAIYDDIPLAPEIELGFYSLEIKATETYSAWANVLVAAFRKPEFEVKAAVSPTEVIAGQAAQAMAQATYFFGGAVKQAAVRWALFRDAYVFTYDDGKPWSFTDFQPDAFYEPIFPPFREPIADGTGTTDDEGRFTLAVPTELAAEPTVGPRRSETRIIEFAITDISDQEVAANTSLVIHAAGVYPGVRPESYVGMAGSRQLAHFIAVEALSRRPLPGQRLEVTITQIAWRTVRERGEDGILRFVTKAEETTVRQDTVTTDSDGQARLEWTPAEPGQYLIRATARDGLGNALRSAAFVWVAGQDYAAWPIRNNDRIDLVADKKLYRVGETARVLVPSPWQGPTTALLTIERGGILKHEVRVLNTNSETLDIPIRPEYAPNVFVSVLLVAPPIGDEAPTFKLGMVRLDVSPEQHMLQLDISADPAVARPGDTVTYRIRATDRQGRPVRAQLSLALVDKALLTLYPDTAPGIDQTFWGARGLGVQTGVSLVASLNRIDEAQRRGFKGGGGGGDGLLAQLDVRTDFRDLAYWQAAAETDAAGNLEVQVTLPDNLTTWQMRVVAVDRETAVADATHELPVRKPLFVRPVLPRFVVHGDRFQVGAIVQNQTGQSQDVLLTFDFTGLTALGQTRHTLTVADGGAVRVDLPVQVDDIDPTSRLVLDAVTVRLQATAGAYGDAIELRLPVRRHSSPETVATGGVVTPDEPRFEAITLPERYDPTQGDLLVRVEPSLAAGLVGALNYLEHFPYECTEQLVS
ncbi:MAG: MG2 domain-containing protein, partial [Anaerolineae bacterium]|nr:MG2 domain-containing protein [Anaerolineae bacterium]